MAFFNCPVGHPSGALSANEAGRIECPWCRIDELKGELDEAMARADRQKELRHETEQASYAAHERAVKAENLLHDVEATPMSEWATQLAAMKENVAGTAALLMEAMTSLQRIYDCASTRFQEDPKVLTYERPELERVLQQRYGDLLFIRDEAARFFEKKG